MRALQTLPIALLLATAVAFPILAQPTSAPAAAPALPGVKPTTGNPNLSVATIKLDNGIRLSQVIGSDVFSSDGKTLGKIADLVMTGDDKVTLAVVSVGGFLGVGSKLVAFPYPALKRDGDRLMLPDMTADKLNAMPNFEF